MLTYTRFIVVNCLIAVTAFCQYSYAIAGKNTFAKYPNQYFIETGSYLGDGIQQAVEAGFPHIFSIELSRKHYQHCCQRFALVPNVKVFFGDSSIVLPSILKQVKAPATFWLDGHYSMGNTAKGKKYSPILEELDAIGKHPIKTHTILIDDIRLLGTAAFDFVDLSVIIQKLLEINPHYQISFEDGYIPNDILVAYIK